MLTGEPPCRCEPSSSRPARNAGTALASGRCAPPPNTGAAGTMRGARQSKISLLSSLALPAPSAAPTGLQHPRATLRSRGGHGPSEKPAPRSMSPLASSHPRSGL
ncbi:unnamed protein product [Coccothraustes coccothraustes]